VSLRARLLAAFAYVLVIVIVALTVPLALNLSKRVDAEIKSEARGQAQLLSASAAGRLGNATELTRLVRRSATELGGRVIVVDARGRLLADSAGGGLRSTSYADRPEIARALRGEADQGTRQSESLDEELLFTTVPVVVGTRTRGAVRVTQSVDAVNDEVRSDVLALIGVGVVALLLGLGVAWLLAGSLARPLRGLADASARVAGGNLDARADEDAGSTEQRELARSFNDMTDRLGRSLTAQREFVANASHQLRTPLTGLRLRLEAASLATRDERVKRDLDAAEHETERLAKLLGELLELARERERPAGVRLSLAEAARDARERWAGPAGRSGHSLVVEGDEEAEVVASAQDVAAILDNLVGNALAYSPGGTTVTIATGRDGGRALLAVLDEGPGLRPEDRERVFERFFRGSAGRDVAGTGLGLAVVDALARRWGGSASIGNREPGGAEARVVLPAATPLPSPDPQLDEALRDRG
jgi:signal transduction histidine kinase